MKKRPVTDAFAVTAISRSTRSSGEGPLSISFTRSSRQDTTQWERMRPDSLACDEDRYRDPERHMT